MATERPDDTIFAGGAGEGEVLGFPDISRGWGVTIDGKNAAGEQITDPTNGIPPMEWFNSLFQRIDQRMLWLLQNALPEYAAGTWPKGATVISNDIVYRAQKETANAPGDGGDWLLLFPMVNLDKRYMRPWSADRQAQGTFYSKLATISETSVDAANLTLLISGANNYGNNAAQTDHVLCSFRGGAPGLEHLILRDAAASGDRATYGFVLSADGKSADFYMIRQNFSGPFSVTVLNNPPGTVQLHTDTPTTSDKPDGLAIATPNFFYSDAHKPAASDVDAVSASKGGEFKEEIRTDKGIQAAFEWSSKPGGLFPGNADGAGYDKCNLDIKSWYGIGFYNTCPGEGVQGRSAFLNVRTGDFATRGALGSDGPVNAGGEINARMTPASANPGDYLNGGLLRSFLLGRGANADPRGAYASLFVQEHVGSENRAVLNLNGFSQDHSWLFGNDGSFTSPGIIVEAGQRVFSPNNPPPVNISGAVTGVRLSALTWGGKIGNDPRSYGDGQVITAVQSHENYAINMEFGVRTIQVCINNNWVSIASL